MSTLYYSDSAKRKVANYLKQSTDMQLQGIANSYSHAVLNDLAHSLVKQILRDNSEITGYDAALKNIAKEATT